MQSAGEKTANYAAKKVKMNLLAPLAIIITSIVMALIAIFVLSDWAETAPLHHAAQHVLIFLAGTSFGGSFLYIITKGVKHEG